MLKLAELCLESHFDLCEWIPLICGLLHHKSSQRPYRDSGRSRRRLRADCGGSASAGFPPPPHGVIVFALCIHSDGDTRQTPLHTTGDATRSPHGRSVMIDNQRMHTHTHTHTLKSGVCGAKCGDNFEDDLIETKCHAQFAQNQVLK